jgi:hypothetical protein
MSTWLCARRNVSFCHLSFCLTIYRESFFSLAVTMYSIDTYTCCVLLCEDDLSYDTINVTFFAFPQAGKWKITDLALWQANIFFLECKICGWFNRLPFIYTHILCSVIKWEADCICPHPTLLPHFSSLISMLIKCPLWQTIYNPGLILLVLESHDYNCGKFDIQLFVT